MYEFTLAGTFGVSLMYLVLLQRYHLRWLGLLVTALPGRRADARRAGALRTPAPLRAGAALLLAGRSTCCAAIIASGAFAVGALASVLFLVKDRAERRGTLRPRRLPGRLPELDALDRVAYRLQRLRVPDLDLRGAGRRADLGGVRLGPLLGLGPQGGVGVHHLGDLRRLPARPRDRRLEGPAAAVIALVGFASLLFNFVGINYFFGGGSMHSYAGH